MTDLLKSATPSHFLNDFPPFRQAPGVGFFFRYGDRQQEIDRHTECASEPLMKDDGPLALPGFQIGQISLSNFNGCRQLCLCHIPPFAKHSDRVIASPKAIDNSLRQQHFMPSLHRRTRLAHQAGGTDVLVGRQCRKALVFRLGQNGEFFSAAGFDELNLSHENLSVVNLAAMPNSDHDKGVSLDVEDDAPVADAKPRSVPALQPLHISLPCLREGREPCLEPSSHIDRETKPLSRGRRCPNDLHRAGIAYSDIIVKDNIAYREMDFGQ